MLTLKVVGPLWGLIWKPSVGNSADHCFQKLFKDASCRMRKYGRCNLPRWYRPRCRRFLHRQVWRVNLHWTFWLVVSSILKNISQWEGLFHILWKIKNGWNHQPALVLQLGYHGLRQFSASPVTLSPYCVPATHVSAAPILVSRQACSFTLKMEHSQDQSSS